MNSFGKLQLFIVTLSHPYLLSTFISEKVAPLYSSYALHDSLPAAVEPDTSFEIFNNPAIQAMFPGCEDVEDLSERIQCAGDKMVEYTYTNIRWPASWD